MVLVAHGARIVAIGPPASPADFVDAHGALVDACGALVDAHGVLVAGPPCKDAVAPVAHGAFVIGIPASAVMALLEVSPSPVTSLLRLSPELSRCPSPGRLPLRRHGRSSPK